MQTPCVRDCKLSKSGQCTGCGRHLDEIARWQHYTEQERQKIMARLKADSKTSAARASGGTTIKLPAPPPDSIVEMRPYLQAIATLRTVETSLRGQAGAAKALIAIVDAESRILAVNGEWRRFAEANGAASWEKVGIGANYLAVCDGASGECSTEASAFAAGLKAVLHGAQAAYELVSPCHAPDEQRWFAGRVTRCTAGETALFSVVHCDVTAQYIGRAA